MYPRMDLCTKDGPSPMAFDPPCFSVSAFFKNAPSLNLLQTADHLIKFSGKWLRRLYSEALRPRPVPDTGFGLLSTFRRGTGCRFRGQPLQLLKIHCGEFCHF